MTNYFGVDVETSGKPALIRALNRLKGTISCTDQGKYREDPAYSVVHYQGDMTEQQFDEWAYNVKVGQCVIGTFTLL